MYKITTNTTCILKKKNNNKPTNHKISIQKEKSTNYIQKTKKILLEKKDYSLLNIYNNTYDYCLMLHKILL
jgi:hypothetical protein